MSTPNPIPDLKKGMILVERKYGRRMQFLAFDPLGLRLTVAKEDPEYKRWISWGREVIWPLDWVWLPGQQMELF